MPNSSHFAAWTAPVVTFLHILGLWVKSSFLRVNLALNINMQIILGSIFFAFSWGERFYRSCWDHRDKPEMPITYIDRRDKSRSNYQVSCVRCIWTLKINFVRQKKLWLQTWCVLTYIRLVLPFKTSLDMYFWSNELHLQL